MSLSAAVFLTDMFLIVFRHEMSIGQMEMGIDENCNNIENDRLYPLNYATINWYIYIFSTSY